MDNNGKDTKSSVKLNRKMRMWHKYRNYCFGAAGVLVALVICVAVIRFMGRSSSDNKQQAAVPPTTAQQTTQSETHRLYALVGESGGDRFPCLLILSVLSSTRPGR